MSSYTPSPTDPTTPLDGSDILLGAQEFRLLKGYIQTNIMPVINAYQNPAASNSAAIIYGFHQFE